MYIPIFFIFCAVVMLAYSTLPFIYKKGEHFSQKRSHQFSDRLDRVVDRKKSKQLIQLYALAPIVGAGVCYVFFPDNLKIFGVILGVSGGIIFPNVYTKILIQQNKRKFNDQLIDALMIMSSSFRGGLSLIQSMEAVVEEMPDPINQEFSIVLGENKMGVSLEESLVHLYNRAPSPALQQMNTAILLARETGGNLPAIFQRIVAVIRQQKKIQGQLDTLTLQGKIQGVVMSLLPIAFFLMIYSTNSTFFDHMFKSEMGRMLLVYAAISEVIGSFLIFRISALKEY